jgi:hypothetical protein
LCVSEKDIYVEGILVTEIEYVYCREREREDIYVEGELFTKKEYVSQRERLRETERQRQSEW